MEIITRKEAIAQGLKRYFTGKPCKSGHVSERYASNKGCCECAKERKEYNMSYYKKNRDEIAKRNARYRKSNKDRLAEHYAKYYKNNKEKVDEYNAEYRKANKEKIAEHGAKYKKANPIPYFIRRSLARIQSNWKGGRAKEEQTLGYTYEQLQQRIECQFRDGMDWENRSEWHIDHKKPVSRFINQGITDPAIINALSNLQPLWAHENLSKGTKWHE